MTLVFIKGDDETLVAQAVQAQVKDLVGDGDRSLLVEELTEESYGEGPDPSLAALVTAAQTMPFLTDRRIVVGRHLGLFSKAAMVGPLVELLDAMPDTTDLILVWEKASSSSRLPTVPKPLNEALKSAAAEVINASPSGKGRKSLLEERLASAPLQFSSAAKRAIVDRIGDDVGRLSSTIDLLTSTFGYDVQLSEDDVSPFLGTASDIPPWELTDAIDGGNIALALDKLERMTVGGDRHPLQVLATLHNHYQRALRLDGSSATNEKTAAGVLQMSGQTFPARKALALSQKLGREKLTRVIGLLSDADLSLRGSSAIPPHTVVTVLVARLARLSR